MPRERLHEQSPYFTVVKDTLYMKQAARAADTDNMAQWQALRAELQASRRPEANLFRPVAPASSSPDAGGPFGNKRLGDGGVDGGAASPEASTAWRRRRGQARRHRGPWENGRWRDRCPSLMASRDEQVLGMNVNRILRGRRGLRLSNPLSVRTIFGLRDSSPGPAQTSPWAQTSRPTN